MFNIALVGSGNLAWHLGPALENAGHTVRQVYSRDPKNAKKLIERLYHAELNTDLDFSRSNVDIVILVVSDDAIELLAQEIVLPDGAVLAHTSGAQSLDKLGYAAADYIGVFYPLQTFSKNKSVDFNFIPILIESEDKLARERLHKLAKSISRSIYEVSSQQRAYLHLAAVFACNFTNHLLHISAELLKDHKLPAELLHPLIAETINKSMEIGHEKAQTGPALRGDMNTLEKHMQLLADQEDIAEIYRVLTQHIMDTHVGKK
jgi:predicted short-subunit dehydrogenase-like oxidoreductase (DUF2520 family)